MADLAEMQTLISQIADHIKAGTKADKRQAANKLERIAAIATTLSFTLRPQL